MARCDAGSPRNPQRERTGMRQGSATLARLVAGCCCQCCFSVDWERTRWWWCGGGSGSGSGSGSGGGKRVLHATAVVEPRDFTRRCASGGRGGWPALGRWLASCVFWQLSNVTVHGAQIAYASGTRCISLASGLSRPWRPLRCMNNQPRSPSAVTHDACRRPRKRV